MLWRGYRDPVAGRVLRRPEAEPASMLWIVVTCGPFVPSARSHTRIAPSSKRWRPACSTTETWRKASAEPSSGVTKPKPLDALYHFTVARTWVANGRGVRGNPKDIWKLNQHGVVNGYVVHLSCN